PRARAGPPPRRRVGRLSRLNDAPDSRPAGIRADGVGFRYAGSERSAIRDVAFTLEPGELLLLLGPSGSGKSTLARAIAGLVPREFRGEWHGSLRIGDLEVPRAVAPQVSARVGIVFQDPASQLVMERAADDVAFGLENRAWARDAMRSRVPAVLDEVGLRGFESRASSRLSGGEQ